MKLVKFGYILGLCFWATPLACMDDQIKDELAQEQSAQIIKRLGGKTTCDKILAQWSEYEKRLLVTMLNEPKWPTYRIGAPMYFAKGKEVYKDRFTLSIDHQKLTVTLPDFKILAALFCVPVFASYQNEMRKFAHIREHFETEDEAWEQMDRQLNRGK